MWIAAPRMMALKFSKRNSGGSDAMSLSSIECDGAVAISETLPAIFAVWPAAESYRIAILAIRELLAEGLDEDYDLSGD
jgi:hypothetical protein